MIVLLVAVTFLLILIISLKIKVKNPGVPTLPGAWPIVGHIPLLLGDNIKLYKTIDKLSKASIKSGGSTCISLGVTNYYFFTDPDDSYAIMNVSVAKHYVYNFAKPWLGEGLFIAEQTTLGPNAGQLTVKNQKVVNAIEVAMGCLLNRATRVWLYLQPIYEASTTKRELHKSVNVINEFANQLLQQRKSELKHESKVEESDAETFTPFVDNLIRISKDNKEFQDKQVVDEINNLIIAGYDATANTLLFALMLLGHHQDIQDKVYDELTEVFGDTDRDLEKHDLNKLVFLEAFIKEVMRLYTSAPLVARNVYTDVKLKNCTIPAGTSCFISLYGLHRNPEWGIDAEVFNPDRWMNPETIPKNPNLYAPFGMGKRYCVGKTFAMMSLKTTLSYVIRNYRIKADMNKLVMQMMLLIKPASGHHISLELRI